MNFILSFIFSILLNPSTVLVKIKVLTVESMKMAVFWVVTPCSLVEVYRRFRDVPSSGFIALMMERLKRR
jgi:hypothetical protein